jgi:hypothetical protein
VLALWAIHLSLQAVKFLSNVTTLDRWPEALLHAALLATIIPQGLEAMASAMELFQSLRRSVSDVSVRKRPENAERG